MLKLSNTTEVKQPKNARFTMEAIFISPTIINNNSNSDFCEKAHGKQKTMLLTGTKMILNIQIHVSEEFCH